jgi:hypothetical protein
LDACRGGTVRLHERQAFDKPQRRKPRPTAQALRVLWGLWRRHRVLSHRDGPNPVWGSSLRRPSRAQ